MDNLIKMYEYIHVSEGNFEQEIIKSSTPVLVEFGGVWCKPCIVLEPMLQQLCEEWGKDIKLVKVDVDESPELAIRYGVMSIPTTILFINGEQRETMIGLKPRNRVSKIFKKHL